MRAALFLILLGACASSSARSAPDRVILESSDGIRWRIGNPGAQIKLAVPADTAFSLIKAAYQKIGIELGTVDPAARRVGNSNFTLRRQFGGRPLSAYVSCGDGLTGPLADRAQVFLSLVSTVDATPGGAVISTILEATAQDISSSSSRVACGTTGRFESELRKSVDLIADVSATLR